MPSRCCAKITINNKVVTAQHRHWLRCPSSAARHCTQAAFPQADTRLSPPANEKRRLLLTGVRTRRPERNPAPSSSRQLRELQSKNRRYPPPRRRPGTGRGSRGHPPLTGFVPSGPPSACRHTSGNRRRPAAPRPSPPTRRRRPTAARRAPRCSPRCGSLAPRETWLRPAAPLLCRGPEREKGYGTGRGGAGKEGGEGKEDGRRPAAAEGPGGAERRTSPPAGRCPGAAGGAGPGVAGKRRQKFVGGVLRPRRLGAGGRLAASPRAARVCTDRRARLPIRRGPKAKGCLQWAAAEGL